MKNYDGTSQWNTSFSWRFIILQVNLICENTKNGLSGTSLHHLFKKFKKQYVFVFIIYEEKYLQVISEPNILKKTIKKLATRREGALIF